MIIDLARVRPDMLDAVGGKALGLAAMISTGETVPAGFCLTTEAYRRGEIPTDEVLAAYHALGSGPVAVRSSATAEDLPEASFAGQQETFLGVSGDQAVLDAIRRCWDSLDSERATAYRRDLGLDDADVAMAVIIQRMVDPTAAGVLFTADPITGTRTETVIDAVAGLGTAVVDGTVTPDHYLVADDRPVPHDTGCLSGDQLTLLHATGRRLERTFGAPQDVEWAIDREGTLWLLQSRAITTLFPVPDPGDGTVHAYLETGHMQGMRRPFTPIGMSVLTHGSADWLRKLGIELDPDGPGLMADIGGRLFLDLTSMLRDPKLRRRLPESMKIYGPGVATAVGRLLDDPRFAPRPGRSRWSGAWLRPARTLLPRTLGPSVRAVLTPRVARARTLRRVADFEAIRGPEQATAADRIAWCGRAQVEGLDLLLDLLPPLWTSLTAKAAAAALLRGVAEPAEIEATQRGMPHNPTTEMDLRLWDVSVRAREHRELLLDTPPEELARRHLAGELPEFGLTDFLRRYGHRGAAEIDVGVPRWAEDPTPVFAALAGYLRITDPDQGADRRFRRAAAEAEEALDRLVGRAARTRPLRATLAGFLLRRCRSLAGLRELPKFAWLFPLNETRRQLLLAGAELTDRGLLRRADDIRYLSLPEALAAARGEDLTDLVEQRRATHRRETRRRQVPGLLLSDGTMPELVADESELPDGVWRGMPAAPGRATGRARVVEDPATARIEPGDILVAATTDPGWTPLFLTAGGLVTETGSPVAHGPTVAREYGIPAVICLPAATSRIRTGQTLIIDGAAGTVQPADD
ncbi:MAG TPA: PEP/pyruvate-binding domain-containing protein [Microlunatus sp.]|nr:PEP/pyruvate-binding domain-containing protein [Microlunatus sp.]